MKKTRPILKKFGRHLRRERLKKNLSQETLAHRAKMSRNFVGMVERGERNITIAKVGDIAKALGVKRWDLMRF